jgi:hypothetical protein
VFGGNAVSLWKSNAGLMDYMHDFVATEAAPLPGISFATQTRVYRAIATYTLPRMVRNS